MPGDVSVYNSEGIKFSYPSNWTLQEDVLDDDTDIIMVTCPDESFWMLAIYPGDVDPDHAAKNVLGLMTGEYENIENIPVRRFIGERILHGYEMNFFYLDLTSTALVLGFREGDQTYIVYWQSCDRMAVSSEKLACSDVFEAMTVSLLDNLENPYKIFNPEEILEDNTEDNGREDPNDSMDSEEEIKS